MKSVSGKEPCKILEKHGWELRRVKGRHFIYSRAGQRAILTVAVHGHRDLKTGTLHALLKQAGLTEADL